jgi:hypothetical protein
MTSPDTSAGSTCTKIPIVHQNDSYFLDSFLRGRIKGTIRNKLKTALMTRLKSVLNGEYITRDSPRFLVT